MSVRTWFDALKLRMSSAPIRRQRRAHGVRRLAARPLRLESLEDRRLLSFTPAASFPVGMEPQAVVTADFNNDGRLDLATANSGGNSVSVRLGDGLGGFGDVNRFAAGTNPRSVVVADFNNDGNLDLATANEGSYAVMTPPYDVNRVSLMLGDGRGGFSAPVNDPSIYGIYGDPVAMAAGDFDRDGKMDLAVTTRDIDDTGEGYLNLLLGDGGGGFTGSGSLDDLTSDSPVAVAVADLNADGKLDVVTANADRSSVSVLLGNGDGTLGAERSYATGTGPQGVAVGDFTGDGIADLVATGLASGWVDVLPGRGDGTFTARIQNFAYLGSSIATADFNGDFKLDVVTAWLLGENLSVLLGRGDGTFIHPEEPWAGSSITAVAVGDFNGDSQPDVVAADWGSNAVSVLLNDGVWPAMGPTLPGDYNQNDTVDAADYVVWRKMLGSSVAPYSGADGNGDTEIDGDDYDVWTAHFGMAVATPGADTAAEAPTFKASANEVRESTALQSTETTSPAAEANVAAARAAGFAMLDSPFHRQDSDLRSRGRFQRYGLAESDSKDLQLLAIERVERASPQDFTVAADHGSNDIRADDRQRKLLIDELPSVIITEWRWISVPRCAALTAAGPSGDF